MLMSYIIAKIDDDSYIIEIKDGFDEYCNEIFADDNKYQ